MTNTNEQLQVFAARPSCEIAGVPFESAPSLARPLP
jgi:hypothetical protein